MTPSSSPPNRVPAPTASFWVVKVLTTGMGEALSDFLVTRFPPVPAVLVTALVFVVVLTAQFRARRYRPWTYWSAVCMVGVFGTMVADVAHVALGIPYAVSSAAFLVVLAAVFLVWRRADGTPDVHAITTTARESFYWAAVIATFALGTAAGDLVAATFGLGYLAAAIVFTVGIVVVVGLRCAGALGPVTAFWGAYVLTRPIGASLADWFAVAPSRGGLGFGTGLVSAIALVAITAAVAAAAGRPARRPLAAPEH